MAFVINKQCTGCRCMIGEDDGQELLAFVPIVTEYAAKTRKLKGKFKNAETQALCKLCTAQFKELIEAQRKKGFKVL